MSSTRRKKANASKSREVDMMSEFDNIDLMVGNDNINPIERELANTIEGPTSHYDTEYNSHPWRTFRNEINLRLSQEMDSMMSMMHSQTY